MSDAGLSNGSEILSALAKVLLNIITGGNPIQSDRLIIFQEDASDGMINITMAVDIGDRKLYGGELTFEEEVTAAVTAAVTAPVMADEKPVPAAAVAEAMPATENNSEFNPFTAAAINQKTQQQPIAEVGPVGAATANNAGNPFLPGAPIPPNTETHQSVANAVREMRNIGRKLQSVNAPTSIKLANRVNQIRANIGKKIVNSGKVTTTSNLGANSKRFLEASVAIRKQLLEKASALIQITDELITPDNLKKLSADDLQEYIEFNEYIESLKQNPSRAYSIGELTRKIDEFDDISTILNKPLVPSSSTENRSQFIPQKVRSILDRSKRIIQAIKAKDLTDEDIVHNIAKASILIAQMELAGAASDAAVEELEDIIANLEEEGAEIKELEKSISKAPAPAIPISSLMARATPIIEKIRAKYEGKEIPAEINNKLTLLELLVLTNSNKENKEVAEKDRNKLEELVEYFEKMNTEATSAPVTASKGALDRSASSRLGFGPQKRAGPPNPILQGNPAAGKGRLIIGKTGP